MKFLLLVAFWLALSLTHAQNLTIGTSSDNPPFASLADKENNFYGFEIDIMLSICKIIAATCDFKPVMVSQLSDQLIAGKIDLAIASIIIPATAIDGLIFSLPYLPSKAQFIVKIDSNINRLNQLKNKKVGVRRGTLFGGTFFEQIILDMFNSELKVLEYPNMGELMLALEQQDIDAAFSNEAAVKYWFINNKDMFKLVSDPIPIGKGYAIMAKAGQEPLIEQINKAITLMMADGSYMAIYSRYF